MADLSFLPDQPKKKEEEDLSFLPDKPSDISTGKTIDKSKSYSLLEVPGESLKNLPTGMLNYAKAIFDPQTYKRLAQSTQLLSPYERTEEGFRKKVVPQEALQAVSTTLYDKYGSYENVKRTVAEHPEEIIGDISTAISGVGGLTGLSRVAEIGRVIEPVNLMTAPLKAASRVVPESARLRLYSSAIKGLTGKKISWDEKQNILKKGIQEGVFPNESGLSKLQGKIDAITDVFDETVTQGVQAGKTIKSTVVLDYLDELENFYKAVPSPEADLSAISNIKKDFLSAHGIEIGAKSKIKQVPVQVDTGLLDAQGKPIVKTILKDEIKNIPGEMEIPIDEAIKIKRAAYAKYKDAFGGLTTAAKETNKNIARGIKEEIIKLNPELRELGKTEKVMIDLQDAIEAGMKRSQNYDIGRFPGLIAGGAAGAATGSGKVAAAVYMAKALLDTPSIKTALAIALDRANKIKIAPKIPTTIRQGLFQSNQLKGLTQE